MANSTRFSHLSTLTAFHGDCTTKFPPDADGVQVSSELDARGREIPDPIPMAPPVGYSVGPSLAETVHRMIHQELSRRAQEEGFETFDEAEDFDIDDDPIDPLTPYEHVFDPPPPAPAPSAESPAPSQQGVGGTPTQASPGPLPTPPGGDQAPG